MLCSDCVEFCTVNHQGTEHQTQELLNAHFHYWYFHRNSEIKSSLQRDVSDSSVPSDRCSLYTTKWGVAAHSDSTCQLHINFIDPSQSDCVHKQNHYFMAKKYGYFILHFMRGKYLNEVFYISCDSIYKHLYSSNYRHLQPHLMHKKHILNVALEIPAVAARKRHHREQKAHVFI